MKKLLAASLTSHDCNVSYFDGNCLHYLKIERYENLKKYSYPNKWQWLQTIKKVWNVEPSDIDEIVLHIPKADEKNTWFLNHPNIHIINHHYCHALSSWMLTEQEPTVHFVIDGLGSNKTWSVYRDHQLIDSGDLTSGSIGFAMRDVGYSLGIKAEIPDDVAGKLMGLQSYGTVDHGFLDILKHFDINRVNDIFSKEHWYHYKDDILLGELTSLDWIKTVHKHMETVLLEFFKKYANKDDIISYSGGVAQNVIWNTVLKNYFPNLVIPPHCGDEGLSLGAIEWLRIKNNLPKFKLDNFPYIVADEEPKVPTFDTIKQAAQLLADGKTIGWYQGHGEIGPRALGNRSILMDPRITDGRRKINTVKNRENYRPFGASILKEHIKQHVDYKFDDTFMLFVTDVTDPMLSAITHTDGTCRLQTVSDSNPVFKTLLEEFYKLTGCPVLLNTSLNTAGKPIAGHKENAKELFYTSGLDCMFIGNEILIK
jgi:carbamoyltransferase